MNTEMTVKEAAEYLDMHYSELIILIRNFAIPSTKFGNQYKVKQSDLDEWKAKKDNNNVTARSTS